MSNTLVDDRDFVLIVKKYLPKGIKRPVTIAYTRLMRLVPYSIKYGFGARRRKEKLPYSVIQDGDTVMQIGAPWDLLYTGRSRSIYFAMMVGEKGRAVIVEPEETSYSKMSQFCEKNGLTSATVVPSGAWSEKTELVFLSKNGHPASNLMKDALTDEDTQNYCEIRVPVNTVDNIVKDLGIRGPKLVSITTNGSEIPILEGMADCLESTVEYISLAKFGLRNSKEELEGHALTIYLRERGFECVAVDDRGLFYAKVKN